jgi:DNA-binding MarR family transcriptional regulator
VQNTLKTAGNQVGFDPLTAAVSDLTALMNQSPLSGRIVREARMSLDPALLRILAVIYRFEPVGLVDLAERVGRDHTTVSRQVTKLQELGLIGRRAGAADRRVNEVLLTAKGRSAAGSLLAAHQRVISPILARWSDKDISELTRLIRKLVDELKVLKARPDPK